jgi:hypothetical protein
MLKPLDISSVVNPTSFMKELVWATTSKAIEALVGKLPVIDENSYLFDHDDPKAGWKNGHLHWVPIGRKRGNAGQISLAKKPIAPLAERLINGMEALIELLRQRELDTDPNAPAPASPREAVSRYFKLPPLELIPLQDKKSLREEARKVARLLLLQLKWDSKAKEFAIIIRDRGIGQTPVRMHSTLLSLGSSDKGDKPYLIGVFGQGGSSTYMASKYSWVVSRRAKDMLRGESDGVGWTIVKHIIPRGRRDHYFAYLAIDPEGRVPSFPVAAAEAIDLEQGTWFGHVDYNFGQSGAAVTRGLYQALNHILYNPVLPFDTEIAGTLATIYGNGYRLSNVPKEGRALNKFFEPQPIP